MRHPIRATVIAVAAILLMAARSEQIYAVQHQPVPAPIAQKLNDDQFGRLFADAAMQKGWRPLPLGPGQIRATLTIRSKHSLTVDILYDRQFYSIVIVGSEALNEANGRIHPAANKAVHGLQDAIQAALSRQSF
jgi:hypothetical protein